MFYFSLCQLASIIAGCLDKDWYHCTESFTKKNIEGNLSRMVMYQQQEYDVLYN